MEISEMEFNFRCMKRMGTSWETKIRPAWGVDVRVDIITNQWTVPSICFAENIDEDTKILLYTRICQIYGAVFSNAINTLRRDFVGDADELALDILMGDTFWNQFDQRRKALEKKYSIKMEIHFKYARLPDEKRIEAHMKERQRQFVHSNLSRICPWCQKYFIPTGPQGYKQVYCHEARRKGKGSNTERGCKEEAKDRRSYLRSKSTLTEEEKEELQRLTAQTETPTKLQWEAKIRQSLRKLGFPDNQGWIPGHKAEEVEILEKQLN